MTAIVEVNQPRQAYIPWLQTLQDHGDVVDVRGRQTREILDAITVVREPWHHCILLPSRRWNPWLALSEALWILAGRNDVAALAPYNSHIGDYSDDSVSLYGAYGKRIFDQIDPLIERLRKDPSDRRAVLQIWDASTVLEGNPKTGYKPAFNDLTINSKDPPCNNMVYFKLRQNKLNMTVICRSNDLHWGLFAVNLPTFGIFQSYIAARLGVDMGTQTHLSNSLHIYTDEPRAVAITNRMLYDEPENMPAYPPHEKIFDPKDKFFIHMKEWKHPHESFAKMCGEILDGIFLGSGGPPFFYFAKQYLKAYREHDLGQFALAPIHEDWILAGRMFTDKAWHD